MELGEKLQELRKKKELTQEELANELYVSRTAISKWESGKGYPNIDSLKVISKYFSVTLDDLLSSQEILNIAEKEHKIKDGQIRDIVFGLLDLSLIMFIILPFFGQRIGGEIREVSLLNFTESEPYIRLSYLISVSTAVISGLLTLVLQNNNNAFWHNNKSKISLGLNAFMVMLFIMSMQPYAAFFTFLFLLIKFLLLLKQA